MTLLDLCERPPVKGHPQTDRLVAFLRQHPHEWIYWKRLEEVTRGPAWRTEVSRARKAPYFLRIEHKNVDLSGNGHKCSCYRWVP